MWLADILVTLMGLFGVFGIAAGIWGIMDNRRERHDKGPKT